MRTTVRFSASRLRHAADRPKLGPMPIDQFLWVLVAILVAAKLLGELAERFGQPAVLGELIAGVLLGASVLGIVHHDEHVIHLLAEIGVIILLFEIGLETDLRRLVAVGPASAITAVVGVAVPFVLGYAVAIAFGLETIVAIVIGASLTATSVGITARVLSDLGRLQEPESQIVLGAAVIDDVIGLIILAVVSGMMAGEGVSAGGIARITLLAFGFIVVVLLLGRFTVPWLFGWFERVGKPETLAIMGLVFAFGTAILADNAGSALIIGAFAAGLVLAPTRFAHAVEEGVVRIGHFFVPIFFVSVGAAVDVRTFADPDVLLLGAALIAVAVAGKFVAGYAPWWMRVKKSVVGVGMIPRGEVGLIFAQAGLTAGVLTGGTFSALTLMVLVTTFVAPPLLRKLFPPVAGGPSSSLDENAVARSVTEA
jgi:Kef-type K+ transport system membrane component KefB